MSKYFVLWSGGVDSTDLVCRLLETKSTVCTFSVSYPAQISGEENQMVARQRLLPKIKDFFGVDFHHYEINLSLAKNFSGIRCVTGSPQILLWLSLGCLYLPVGFDSLAAGYVRGDDFWHFKADAEALVSSASRIRESAVSLFLPLEWESKARVVSDLVSKYPFYRDVWWCESDLRKVSGSPCGECVSCRRFAEAVQEVSGKYSYRWPSGIKKSAQAFVAGHGS